MFHSSTVHPNSCQVDDIRRFKEKQNIWCQIRNLKSTGRGQPITYRQTPARCGPKPKREPNYSHIVERRSIWPKGERKGLLFAITMPKWLTQYNKGASEREGAAIYLFASPSCIPFKHVRRVGVTGCRKSRDCDMVSSELGIDLFTNLKPLINHFILIHKSLLTKIRIVNG